jgi:hypothetical protein
MAIKIPVFLSAPSVLNKAQQEVYDFVIGSLNEENLQPRALGRSDFPQSDPMTEVYYIARACYGGIILGFSQIESENGILRRGTPGEAKIDKVVTPTPWNQIEAGIIVALRRPLLVFTEATVTGGVFDQGAFNGYLQRFNPASMKDEDWEQIRERVRLWSASVRATFRT